MRRRTENIRPRDRRSLWRDIVEENLSVKKDSPPPPPFQQDK